MSVAVPGPSTPGVKNVKASAERMPKPPTLPAASGSSSTWRGLTTVPMSEGVGLNCQRAFGRDGNGFGERARFERDVTRRSCVYFNYDVRDLRSFEASCAVAVNV
ncbi:MAG: hypothetical protein WKF84_23260 [Pyrinomonadaceae bacterium]